MIGVSLAIPQLAGWSNFYVIVGSSAGALTGLMFVVIALTRELQSATSHGRRAFATPTIVHFTTVLSLAGVLSMPGLARGAMGAILMMAGVGLLAYVGLIFRHGRRPGGYEPDLEDLMFHFILPAVAYATILVAGASSWAAPSTSLYLVAGSMLGLLIIGIHNAWDSAVWMVTRDSSS
ncbi:MAG: hypothetical protein ACXVQY_11385 [Actinomycetota bacterium]